MVSFNFLISRNKYFHHNDLPIPISIYEILFVISTLMTGLHKKFESKQKHGDRHFDSHVTSTPTMPSLLSCGCIEVVSARTCHYY